MNFTTWTIEQLQNRVTELRAIAENPGERTTEQLEQLAQERSAIDAELEKRARDAAIAQMRRDGIARGAVGGNTLDVMPVNQPKQQRTFTAASPEYRSGFLRTLLGQELSAEERDAVNYVMTTGDSTNHTGYLMPTTLLEEIWNLIEEEHSILEDVTLYHTGTILEVPLLVSIKQGDAATVNENAKNDDEINEWGHITLSGKDFSKHIDISYAMAAMSIDALESFLRTEIADRLGAALASDAVTQILSDYDDDHNAVVTSNEEKVVFTDITDAMATLTNGKGGIVVYANNATIMKYLVGMVDTTGRPIFQPDAQAGVEGAIVGSLVKHEDAIEDGVFLIGYPKRVVGNVIQDIMIETDRDIKKHVITYAGYCRAEFKLGAAKAFATLTVDEGE